MKKFLAVLMIMAFSFSMMATPVLAGDVTDQFCEGIKQAFTSPKNISDSVTEEYDSAEFKPFGVVGGTVKGVTMTIVDLGIGLVKAIFSPLEAVD